MSDPNTRQDSVPVARPEIDPARLQHALNTMRSEQNFPLALAAGVAAALAGAILWAVVTVTTGFQIGFMAIGVGILVGLSVRKLGKGIDRGFGLTGAGFSLFGCVFGNLLAVCGLIAAQEGVPFMQVLSAMNMHTSTQLMVATFSPIDLLFYAIAVYEGYKFSFRQMTQADLAQVLPEVRTA